MKRITISLPNRTYEGLGELAEGQNASVAKLIRRAVDLVYGEDIKDIRVMQQELAKYLANPASAVSWETLHKKRDKVIVSKQR